jgi:hypothetical protein
MRHRITSRGHLIPDSALSTNHTSLIYHILLLPPEPAPGLGTPQPRGAGHKTRADGSGPRSPPSTTPLLHPLAATLHRCSGAASVEEPMGKIERHQQPKNQDYRRHDSAGHEEFMPQETASLRNTGGSEPEGYHTDRGRRTLRHNQTTAIRPTAYLKRSGQARSCIVTDTTGNPRNAREAQFLPGLPISTLRDAYGDLVLVARGTGLLVRLL